MTRRFFMDDFEQSLKENADEFKMIPSKRVWHGIYNDIHPGRRWPSTTMAIVLVFMLVVVGHLNTHNDMHSFNAPATISGVKNVAANHQKTSADFKNAIQIIAKPGIKSETGNLIKPLVSGATLPGKSASAPQNNTAVSSQSFPENSQNKNSLNFSPIARDSTFTSNLNLSNKALIIAEESTNLAVVAGGNKPVNGIFTEVVIEKPGVNNAEIVQSFNNKLTSQSSFSKDKIAITGKVVSQAAPEVAKPANETKKILKPAKKRNPKINWVYYVAPEISSVSFKGAAIKENVSAGNSPALAINQKDTKVLYNSVLGFEAGAQLNYAIDKKWKITTGVHFTYSGYNIVSNEVHPTFATLILKDPSNGLNYSRSFITHYGDGTGQTPVLLRSYSLQVSLPVGFQYQLKSYDKFQINTTANFEPSLVLSSNSFVLSSNGRNYVNDISLLRKANISSNFGAFVSFTWWKLNWQVGPNLRYQWLSTYKKDYTVKEHLIDYGIRIGISK